MTFDEFENTLQDWLDEDRLDEVERLIPLVCQADRPRCEELLQTYQALFAGLSAGGSFRETELPSPAPEPEAVAAASRFSSSLDSMSLASAVVALAACVAVIAFVPGWFNIAGNEEAGYEAMATAETPFETVAQPQLDSQVVMTSTDTMQDRLERNFVYLSTYSIEPFARNMANQTDTAFRSLGQVSRTLNPIDEQLKAYRDAAPLLETLTDGLLPGSRSLSNAFSLLQETADGSAPQVPPAVQEPASASLPERSAVS
ncbi:hypothetical protein [Blastopirellula marina]|uniref:Uncharacterized protein n=1 Tax=Blastopirellula marina TaxID=124 RepID=A0A2S8GU15_9BACT|nr:hypothetical protein [Blastopirellula marina]PQO47871.1 hypothetical protein C5Y93_02195 [Blastopirellula marina]